MSKYKKNQIVYAMDDGKPTKLKFVKYWKPSIEDYSCQVIDEKEVEWTMNDRELFPTADECLNNHIDELIQELAHYIKMLGTIK